MRDSGAGLISLPFLSNAAAAAPNTSARKRDSDAIGRLKLNRIRWPQTGSTNLCW